MRHLIQLAQAHRTSKAALMSVGPYLSACLWMRDGQAIELFGGLFLQFLETDKPGS